MLINVRTIYAVHTTLDGSSDITAHRTQFIIYKHCHLNQQIVNHFSHNLIPTIVKYAHSFHSLCALQLGINDDHHNILSRHNSGKSSAAIQIFLQSSRCRLWRCVHHSPSARVAWVHCKRRSMDPITWELRPKWPHYQIHW